MKPRVHFLHFFPYKVNNLPALSKSCIFYKIIASINIFSTIMGCCTLTSFHSISPSLSENILLRVGSVCKGNLLQINLSVNILYDIINNSPSEYVTFTELQMCPLMCPVHICLYAMPLWGQTILWTIFTSFEGEQWERYESVQWMQKWKWNIVKSELWHIMESCSTTS